MDGIEQARPSLGSKFITPAPSSSYGSDIMHNGGMAGASMLAPKVVNVVYKARRYAVKFDPPAIFLEYEDADAKRRVRAVKLNKIQPGIDIDRLTRKVIRSFPRKIDTASVKYDQVKKLVVKLVEHAAHQDSISSTGATDSRQSTAKSAACTTPSSTPSSLSSSSCPASAGDSWRPSPLSNVGHPANDAHVAAFVSPNGGVGPVPSLLQSLSPAATSLAVADRLQHESETRDSAESVDRFAPTPSSDDGDGDLDAALDELDRELAGTSSSKSCDGSSAPVSRQNSHGVHSPTEMLSRDSSLSVKDRLVSGAASSLGAHAAAAAAAAPLPPVPQKALPAIGPASSAGLALLAAQDAQQARTRFAAEAERLELDISISGDLDLNGATEVELHMAKAKMDEHFMKHRLKPGDPGFEYDKQVEFGPPRERNEWDDSDDDSPPPPPPRPAPAHVSVASTAVACSTEHEEVVPEELDWEAIAAQVAERKLALSFDDDSQSLDVVQVPSRPAMPPLVGTRTPVADDISAEFP